MAQYVLINPLQQVLTFAEYKKALEKADAFEKQHTFKAEEQKPKRGRPKGTTKKEKPETPAEPKKRGRPPKAKPETPVVKAPVGRPSKIDNYYEETLDGERLKKDFAGTGWYNDPKQIKKILDDFFKETKSIRYKNGMFEVYEDTWALRRPYSKKKLPDPEAVVDDIVNLLLSYIDTPATEFHFSEDRPDPEGNMKRFKLLIKEYLINRFGM